MLQTYLAYFLTASLFLLAQFTVLTDGVQAQDARRVAKIVFPSVVLIVTTDEGGKPKSIGSGFFVRPDLVVTNFHVIEGSTNGHVSIVGKSTRSRIAGVRSFDTNLDLAILKIDTPIGSPVVLADVSKLETGEQIFALGNPRGLEGTISPGIVSGLNLRRNGIERLIQITAPISPGSSGGPVVNTKGEVVGVATASIISGQNLNFAIPANLIIPLLELKQDVTSLADIPRRPPNRADDDNPSYEETARWLSSNLTGFEVQNTRLVDGRQVNYFTEVETFDVSNCTIKVRLVSLVAQMEPMVGEVQFPVRILKDVSFQRIDDLGHVMWLFFEEDVTEKRFVGTKLYDINVLPHRAWRLPIRSVEIGPQVMNALLRINKICADRDRESRF